MEFTVSTAAFTYYGGEDDHKPNLESIGFVFIPIYPGTGHSYRLESNTVKVQLESLLDLVEFTRKFGDCIVGGNEIRIYDNYIE